MAIEPSAKRTFAFFDGQNLFHHAKEAFGYTYPNFDPRKQTERICSAPRGRGINGTDWIRIDRATYDTSIDPNDYRPKNMP